MTSLPRKRDVVRPGANVVARAVADGHGGDASEACTSVALSADADELNGTGRADDCARPRPRNLALVRADFVRRVERALGRQLSIEPRHLVRQWPAIAAAFLRDLQVRALPVRYVARLTLIGA